MKPPRIPLPLVLAALAGCATTPPGAPPSMAQRTRSATPDLHTPDFARRPYERFNRESVVAIALREWRLFGQPVHDEPPESRPPPAPDEKPERWPGLWQRVGEYWWAGVDPEEREVAWTGKHDAAGNEFAAGADSSYAWSAAFISYVMRIAGAGERFPYSATHADYINIAREMSLGQTGGYAITAERPETYAPRPGDIICQTRGGRWAARFDDLPTGRFPAHCDIVVRADPGELSVIGGNVADAVSMKHVPVTEAGTLAEPDGTVLDTRYAWMVVLRVLYDDPPGRPEPIS